MIEFEFIDDDHVIVREEYDDEAREPSPMLADENDDPAGADR